MTDFETYFQSHINYIKNLNHENLSNFFKYKIVIPNGKYNDNDILSDSINYIYKTRYNILDHKIWVLYYKGWGSEAIYSYNEETKYYSLIFYTNQLINFNENDYMNWLKNNGVENLSDYRYVYERKIRSKDLSKIILFGLYGRLKLSPKFSKQQRLKNKICNFLDKNIYFNPDLIFTISDYM
jgi:hypothetical protein